MMNNDRGLFALLSLALLLIALLVPFLILLLSLGGIALAIAFAVLAAVLAVLFGALSWSEHMGRSVAIAALVLLGVEALLYANYGRASAERQSATAEAAAPEALVP